jgi:hypothetical protein
MAAGEVTVDRTPATSVFFSEACNTVASPRSHLVLALVQEEGRADVAIPVDE